MNAPKEPSRITNYKFVKETHQGELPWVRIADLAKMKLKHPVVLLNGCFDLLHSGHMKVIFHARRHAKTLICAMDSDALTNLNKPGRPINSWVERATALGYMPIDYLVEINTSKEFVELVEAIKPDLRVKGAEYREHLSRIQDVPTLFVRDGGIRTSEIVRRIKNAKYS